MDWRDSSVLSAGLACSRPYVQPISHPHWHKVSKIIIIENMHEIIGYTMINILEKCLQLFMSYD